MKSRLFEAEEIAEDPDIEAFEEDASFAEKISLPSSVEVTSRTDTTDWIQLRIKEEFDLSSQEFLDFLKSAHEAYPQ